ncbi:DUF6419 family natural product biosynthesis protein [Pseudoalteromonas sp. SSM20]|uniref:DUF6419 family natural product biosynthesis protein n=1 Tax=Pseudoalteromonas sp. SSM20 TaxID=3139394 RepID=UPI003BA87CDC
MVNVLIGFVLCLSVVFGVISAAAFTPAIGFAFIFILFAGVLGYFGYLQSSLLLILINSLAIIASPGIVNATLSSLILLAILYISAFSGVMIGVRKLQKHVQIKT